MKKMMIALVAALCMMSTTQTMAQDVKKAATPTCCKKAAAQACCKKDSAKCCKMAAADAKKCCKKATQECCKKAATTKK